MTLIVTSHVVEASVETSQTTCDCSCAQQDSKVSKLTAELEAAHRVIQQLEQSTRGLDELKRDHAEISKSLMQVRASTQAHTWSFPLPVNVSSAAADRSGPLWFVRESFVRASVLWTEPSNEDLKASKAAVKGMSGLDRHRARAGALFLDLRVLLARIIGELQKHLTETVKPTLAEGMRSVYSHVDALTENLMKMGKPQTRGVRKPGSGKDSKESTMDRIRSLEKETQLSLGLRGMLPVHPLMFRSCLVFGALFTVAIVIKLLSFMLFKLNSRRKARPMTAAGDHEHDKFETGPRPPKPKPRTPSSKPLPPGNWDPSTKVLVPGWSVDDILDPVPSAALSKLDLRGVP
ncbi:hypothetical protein CYMTET_20892, partial [Cymbomonas tetramitiformis]